MDHISCLHIQRDRPVDRDVQLAADDFSFGIVENKGELHRGDIHHKRFFARAGHADSTPHPFKWLILTS